jgi:sulfur carrier protein
MKICLNGKDIQIACATLQELWEREQAEREIDSSKGFAIAINSALVPKRDWPTTSIRAGDKIEIVRAISGG